jgi:hypothetical protein
MGTRKAAVVPMAQRVSAGTVTSGSSRIRFEMMM